MHLDAERLKLDKASYLVGWTCIAISKSSSFHSYSSCGHGGADYCSLDYSEVPTKAGISNPLDYHVLSFPSAARI